MYRRVEIGKSVTPSRLELALRKAATQVGLGSSFPEEKYRKFYVLGSVKEEQEYEETKIKLRGGVLYRVQLEVSYNISHGLLDKFYISSGLFGGISQERVQKYLDAVSRGL